MSAFHQESAKKGALTRKKNLEELAEESVIEE